MTAIIRRDIIQGSAEWHDLRQTKIGASDATAIMDLSPWKTPYQLWQEKTGFKESPPPTAAMARGIELEAVAREKVSKWLGIEFQPTVAFHPSYPWMMASLDGLDSENNISLEIKCPNPNGEDHATAKEGVIPEKYFPQIQHQMEVLGHNKALYYSFDGKDGVLLEISRDAAYWKEVLSKEIKFYHALRDFIPPELGPRDYAMNENPQWIALAHEWEELEREINKMEKRKQNLKAELIELSDGQNMRGGGIKLSRIMRKGNVDYSKIPELEKVDLEKYRKDPLEIYRVLIEK